MNRDHPLLLLDRDAGLTDAQFFALCQANGDLIFERDAHGQIIVMPPTGGDTSIRNSDINYELKHWARSFGGYVFDSNGGFLLPNSAIRSPDAAWLQASRYEALPTQQRKQFVPLCPDFIVELVSESDSAAYQRDKMLEYMANGCQLGWLILPRAEEVWVYRPGQPEPEVVRGFDQNLEAGPLMPGFALDLRRLR